MNPIKIDPVNNVIVIMSRTFEKKACYAGSAEYAMLQTVRRDYPEFRVVSREIKKNTKMEHYNGLTYDYMRWYITHYEVEERRDKMLDVLNKKIDISKCHSTGKRYATIKSWFLTQYPAVKEFGMSAVDKAAEDEAAEIEKKNVIQMEDDVEKMDKAS